MANTIPVEAVGQRPAWIDSSLYPFESKYLEIDGARVHYVDEGSGPILLMLHGNPTWSFLYRKIILGLRNSFRCVALDYPGFGLSTAPEGYNYTPNEHAEVVEKFINAMNLYDVTLVMQDWGGPIGLWVAGRNPDRIHGLVIGNTFAWPVNGDPHFERFAKTAGGRMGKFFIDNFNAFVNVAIPTGTHTHVKRQIMHAYRGPFSQRANRSHTHVLPREILASRDFLQDVENSLPRLQHLPVLILWGIRDGTFRRQELRRFEQAFPGHSTVILEDAAHFIQEDAPEQIVEEIQAWWENISPTD